MIKSIKALLVSITSVILVVLSSYGYLLPEAYKNTLIDDGEKIAIVLIAIYGVYLAFKAEGVKVNITVARDEAERLNDAMVKAKLGKENTDNIVKPAYSGVSGVSGVSGKAFVNPQPNISNSGNSGKSGVSGVKSVGVSGVTVDIGKSGVKPVFVNPQPSTGRSGKSGTSGKSGRVVPSSKTV
jgi:hypothetical protein